jgi:hypothetical protein
MLTLGLQQVFHLVWIQLCVSGASPPPRSEAGTVCQAKSTSDLHDADDRNIGWISAQLLHYG